MVQYRFEGRRPFLLSNIDYLGRRSAPKSPLYMGGLIMYEYDNYQ
jgi:hypothetical protein